MAGVKSQIANQYTKNTYTLEVLKIDALALITSQVATNTLEMPGHYNCGKLTT